MRGADDGTLQSILYPAGADADVIAEFTWVLFAVGALIVVAVVALMALSLRDHARPLRAGLWIAGAGIAFPVLVLSALLVWSTWRSTQLAPHSSNDALSVSVTARMGWWDVRYRDPASGREIVAANEIHVPVGQSVSVGLNAANVIHSLWVPTLSGKRDMSPGRVTRLTLRAERPGVYRGRCAEFCGTQHARMALHVVALAPAAFRAWLAQQAQPARAPHGALLEQGRAAFLAQRCQTCHTIRGVAETAQLGPDLTHVGSRRQIGAGLLRTHQGLLRGWVANPQSFKPGVFMPAASGIDGESLRALAAYLEHLQ